MAQTELMTSHDVYTLPLTHVSLEHGTDGLMLRLQRALGEVGLQDDELIQASISLGLDLHRDDRRTYEPHVNHLLRVMLRAIEDLGVNDRVVIASCPLHDTIEDHPKELAGHFLEKEVHSDNPHFVRELGYQGLRVFASRYDAPEVADIVLAVSNPILLPGSNKTHRYVQHVDGLMQTRRPGVLKVADVLDNVDVPPGLEAPEKRAKLDRKQIGVYGLIEAKLRGDDSPVTGTQRERTLTLLALRRAEAVGRLGYDPEDT